MSGSRFLLDTNALVSLLAGDTALVGYLNAAEWVESPSSLAKLSFKSYIIFCKLSSYHARIGGLHHVQLEPKPDSIFRSYCWQG